KRVPHEYVAQPGSKRLDDSRDHENPASTAGISWFAHSLRGRIMVPCSPAEWLSHVLDLAQTLSLHCDSRDALVAHGLPDRQPAIPKRRHRRQRVLHFVPGAAKVSRSGELVCAERN